MNFQTIITTRRDGKRHTDRELHFLAEGAAKGTIPDYQLAAWLMAAYLNPLDDEETAWLTMAMAESGDRIDLSGLPKPWVDKHSTGGVGDKTTIILLPILAACGLTLVKMSGRGLGTTGGTLDKLASVPGFRIDLTPEEMKAQAAKIGLAITGQSPDLAPADKAIYALRDVTGTVESIPLLVSSILSKKIAGGADVIVLDVKSGSGGFMRTEAGARSLAAALARTAKACGLNCHLALTDMEQPLGCVGNAIEIEEARQALRNEPNDAGTQRLIDLCLDLSGVALRGAGLAPDLVAGREMARRALESGDAYEKARQWFAAQGASIDAKLPQAAVRKTVEAQADGWVETINAELVGRAVIDIGGGRRKKEDKIDPSAGVEVHTIVGARIARGEPLFTVFASTEKKAQHAAERVSNAITFSDEEVAQRPVVLEVM
ncbi:thymidine phosphorylase [Fimbriimonas ginsengisoli]|nr:thymidine phosphorylase [Fimbriimonas ginsengisoli]